MLFLPENIFIPLSYLKDIFTAYGIQGQQFLTAILHYLLIILLSVSLLFKKKMYFPSFGYFVVVSSPTPTPSPAQQFYYDMSVWISFLHPAWFSRALISWSSVLKSFAILLPLFLLDDDFELSSVN